MRNRLSPKNGPSKVSAGISPHTPYTVSEKLLKKCAALARAEDIPLCIHLSESPAETEFLCDGTGEILEFRREFGLPQRWKAPRKTPVQYIRDISLLDKPAVLVHCNYVDEQDMDAIAASHSVVVFCPQSHQYFRHRLHPLERMIEKGIPVALGTDSLVSSPSLNVLEEMKAVLRTYGGVSPVDILKMATLNGLKALSFPYEPEFFHAGSSARLTGIIVAPDELERARDPLEALFSESAEAVFSMVRGKIILHNGLASHYAN